MLNHAGDGTNFSRAASGGHDVKVFGQRDIAGSHVEHSFPRSARQRFHFADGDGVFACGQIRDGDVKFLPLISSRKAAVLLVVPSMATDASSLRCAKSPLTLTC